VSDNVKKAIKVIDDLLKAEIGNPERLESIKEKLENKIPITAEDVEYLQEQREKLGKIKPKEEPEESKPEEPKDEDKALPKPEKEPEDHTIRNLVVIVIVCVIVIGGLYMMLDDIEYQMNLATLQNSMTEIADARSEEELDMAFYNMYNDQFVVGACNTIEDKYYQIYDKVMEEVKDIPPLPNTNNADITSWNIVAKKYNFVEWTEMWTFCLPVYNNNKVIEQDEQKAEELGMTYREYKFKEIADFKNECNSSGGKIIEKTNSIFCAPQSQDGCHPTAGCGGMADDAFGRG